MKMPANYDNKTVITLLPVVMAIFFWFWLFIDLVWDIPKPFNLKETVYAGMEAQKFSDSPNAGNVLSMNDEIAETILDLSSTEFFGEGTDFSEREFALLDRSFEGLAIKAPSAIYLADQNDLPVVMAISDTTRRQWEVYRDKNLALVAMSKNSDTILIEPAFSPPEKEPVNESFSCQPPEPEEIPPYTRSAKIEIIQARPRLDLPWKPGSYALAVINYDWISNVVEVEFKGPGISEESKLPIVAPGPVARNTVILGEEKISLPNYDILPYTPPLPQEGVEFMIPPEAATPTSLSVFGAFSLKARSRYVNLSSRGNKKLPIVGVVPVTLLLFGLDRNVPNRFDWTIPVYGSALVAVGEQLTGYFAIDALQGSDIHLSSGRYMAYIICDSRIYGPREVKL